MTIQETLRGEAERACTWRGHQMVWLHVSETKEAAECSICKRGVWTDTSPPPNGIDIHGEAVALNCND